MVKSEDDSGLETLWLLKKIAFLSEKETEEKGEVDFLSAVIRVHSSSQALGGSKAQPLTQCNEATGALLN